MNETQRGSGNNEVKRAKARSRTIVSLLSMGMLLGCAVVSLAVRAHNRTEASSPSAREVEVKMAAPLAPRSPSQTKQQSVVLPGHGVSLTPHGFEPNKIIRPAGQFVIAVIGQAGLESASFVVSDSLGNQLSSAQVQKERASWSDTYNLAPGHYVLRELAHPDWVCDITIK
jgi:hypothetical protein